MGSTLIAKLLRFCYQSLRGALLQPRERENGQAHPSATWPGGQRGSAALRTLLLPLAGWSKVERINR